MTDLKKIETLFARLSNNAKGLLILSSEISNSRKPEISVKDVATKVKDFPVEPRHLFVGILLTPQSLSNRVMVSMGLNTLDLIKKLGYEDFINSRMPENFAEHIKNVLFNDNNDQALEGTKGQNDVENIGSDIQGLNVHPELTQEELDRQDDIDLFDFSLKLDETLVDNENVNTDIPNNENLKSEAERFAQNKENIKNYYAANSNANNNGVGGDKINQIFKEYYDKLISGGQVFKPGDTISKDILLSEESVKILSKAYQIANKYEHVYVGTEHILLAMLSFSEMKFTKELNSLGLNYEGFAKSLSLVASYPIGILVKPDSQIREAQSNQFFNQIGTELVQAAKDNKLDPVVGREKELEQLINILSRRKKNNPIIVGDAGVGKTAMIEGLAQKIAKGEVPGSLSNMKIISIDVPGIVAGSKLRGDVEEKVISIIEEVKSRNDVIVFIDEIQNIVQSGSPSGGMDIASILKPALVNGDFKCIGATTREDYARYFEDDNALSRRFQPVYIEEPTVEESILILQRLKTVLEKHHNITISDEAIESAVKLSDRFVSDRYLPDKAIDLLDEAAASRRIEVEVKFDDITKEGEELKKIIEQKETAVAKGDFNKAGELRDMENEIRERIKKGEKKKNKTQKSAEYFVDLDTIRKIISKWTGIPLDTIDREQKNSLLNLEENLEKKVIGQNEAVKKVAAAIKRARAGISSADRPWASFLFLGPTGVGKTELAKVLTEKLFGDEDRLIQIDMSELMEMHSVSKLIGSPPGYVGFREGGMLTEQVKEHPYSVILFDEIEKAHNDVLNVLLQVLEYGHLTDGRGKKVNFKNTVIILTSNIGAEDIRKSKVLGFIDDKEEMSGGFAGVSGGASRSDKSIENAYDSMKDSLIKKLKDTIRPELLNRLDDIVIFRSLTRKDAKAIVLLLVGELNARLLDKNISVELDKTAINYIVKEGFSEEYGARPLRRALQDKLESKLADYILRKGDGELRKQKFVTALKVGEKKGQLAITE